MRRMTSSDLARGWRCSLTQLSQVNIRANRSGGDALPAPPPPFRIGSIYQTSKLAPPLHLRCTFVAYPLHIRCISVAYPLHIRCISVAPPLHLCCTSVAPPLHLRYTSVTPPLHLRCTSVTPPLHLRYTVTVRRCRLTVRGAGMAGWQSETTIISNPPNPTPPHLQRES